MIASDPAIRRRFLDGQQHFADAMRGFVHGVDPDLLAFLLEAAGPDVFLEPMLFAHVRAGGAATAPIDIPQLVFGYLAEDARPDQMPIRTDGVGVAYLPRYGYLVTGRPDAELVLHTDGAPRVTTADGTPVDALVEPIRYLPGTCIEVYRRPNPLLATILIDRVTAEPLAVAVAPTEPQIEGLGRGLDRLRRVRPELFTDLTAAVRGIAIVSHPRLHTCSTIKAHGAVVLNAVEGDSDEVFFVDELVHHGGHVILNAITSREADTFAIPSPHVPMASIHGDAAETRTVYSCFHSLYTEMLAIDVLGDLLARGVYAGRQAHELLGRVADIAAKARGNAPRFSPALLTGIGTRIHAAALDALDRLDTRLPGIAHVDLSSQPYTFSYARFAASNPPPAPDLHEHMRARMLDGQQQLADATRAFLHTRDPELLAFLGDAAREDVFTEPMLFAHIRSQPDADAALSAMVYGYLHPDLRPDAIEVRTDAHGRVYLPRIGTLHTARPDQAVLLHTTDGGVRITTLAGEPVAARHDDVLHVPGTSIEVYRHVPSPIAAVLARPGETPIVADVRPEHIASLGRAFAFLREHQTRLHADLMTTVRAVCLFSHPRQLSCAAIAAHGVVYINVGDEPLDEIFFLDELAHQGGHVILHGIAVDERDFFAVADPDAPLSTVTHVDGETRSIYSCFHGVYTELLMIETLRAALDGPERSPRQRHELLGRLADITAKLRMDSAALASGVLHRDGAWIHGRAVQTLDEVLAAMPALTSVDLRDQPYVFSYRRFLAANPPRAAA